MRSECFFFQEDLVSVIEQMLFDVCPGLLIERHVLSSSQLQAHSKQVFSYSPILTMRVLLRDGVYGTVINEQTNAKETLLSLLFFSTPEVLASNQQHEHLETLNTQIRIPVSSSMFPHSQTSPLLQRQNQLPHTTAGRRRSLPQQQTPLPRSMSQSSASQLLQNRCSNLQVLRSDSSPALLQDQNPVVTLVSDLHASQLPLLCCQCFCAILDPQESMGRDWCMLGVLLGMTDKLPKLDPGDNPAFSPTACILGEWLKRPDSTVGQLLMKLEELERNDAVEALMSTLPLFRITPSGFQDLKDIESHTIHEQSATSL
ncbi:uncharacterized protein LOC118201814 [Stegodyphus dumicola]|uniref:uncharacterized protein LOC118201814 n=1 Tax=Stegodyphus dumicola TaxID=202533 RepID=UPI0015AD751D|nr:uncharacterized protein LOC118201814 [Stegodyphus dumicola]